MQDREERLAADARVLALSGRMLWLVVIAGVTLTTLLTMKMLQGAFILTAVPGTEAIRVDFRIFWAAAQLALQGEPLAAFDMTRLSSIHNVAPDEWMPWLYPPGYLVLLMPFGAMSFSYGFLIFTLLSVVLVGLAVRPFVANSTPVWLALTLAPAHLPTLILGQNSLLWLAGLVAALAALGQQRWILAGVLIGCLTLKPQMGLLIPVALLAAGFWRTIFAAAATAIVLAALPTLLFGPEYWPMLVDRLAEHSEYVLFSLENLFLMAGPFYLLTWLGLSTDVAIWIQWGITLLSAGIVWLLWRSNRISFDAKAAGLMLAMLLSGPYLWYYEVAMMAVIGLFMVRAGLLGHSVPQYFLLFCLWLGGCLPAANAFIGFAAQGHLIVATMITPVLLASMTIILLHYGATRRASALES